MAKKKINDDTLLQLIRDGNSPTGVSRRLGAGRAAVSKSLKALKIGGAREVTFRSNRTFTVSNILPHLFTVAI